ncbi:AraC family transcriptional regulator [Paenibacillus filicis]|uniref:AraC family transcriptional regulator n=1 Tax=Paenibacillus gyeongsangnamensis TaxID=3388067 RepID=A0ABT4Q274_9BACL|nr:AraC family transcriptional regulator [Paenibacillus filicis]MCZ8510983.1 AraC family transcriptional regulator [Paenibacillus filicis]
MDKPHDFSFGPVTSPFPVFWLVLDGTRTIQIEEERHMIHKGDLVVFPPGVPYQLHPSEADSSVRYLALSCTVKLGPFDFHELYPFPKMTAVSDGAEFNGLSALWMESVGLFEQFVALYERNEHHTADENRGMAPDLTVSLALLRVQGALHQWFAQLLSLLLPQMPDQPPVIDPRIVKACTYMQEHVQETIPLEKLAAHVYLSPSHFSHLFRMALGQPPAQYLRNYRIRLAKELLVQTSWPVGEISQLVGYGELSEFSRAFRKAAGQSPQAYRQERRHTNI